MTIFRGECDWHLERTQKKQIELELFLTWEMIIRTQQKLAETVWLDTI